MRAGALRRQALIAGVDVGVAHGDVVVIAVQTGAEVGDRDAVFY